MLVCLGATAEKSWNPKLRPKSLQQFIHHPFYAGRMKNRASVNTSISYSTSVLRFGFQPGDKNPRQFFCRGFPNFLLRRYSKGFPDGEASDEVVASSFGAFFFERFLDALFSASVTGPNLTVLASRLPSAAFQ